MHLNPMTTTEVLDEYVRLIPGTVWIVTRSRRNDEAVDLLTVRFRNGDVVTHLQPIQLFESSRRAARIEVLHRQLTDRD